MFKAISRILHRFPLLSLFFGPRKKHWIQTYTGKKFFPLDPDIRLLDIRDQARALSMICRYIGHTSRFYSVAEHSVRISRRLEELGYDLETQRHGLVHDNTESYLGDVPRPLKVQWYYWFFRRAEKRLGKLIAEWLSLYDVEPMIVKMLDTEILGTEARIFKSPVHPDWAATTATGQLSTPWVAPESTEGRAWGWPPDEAEFEYLARFRELFGAPMRFTTNARE